MVLSMTPAVLAADADQWESEIDVVGAAVFNGKSYGTVQEAVAAAGGGVVKLLADSDEEVTAQGDLYLDLNGYSLQKVTVSGKLYGMDSATNAYEASGAKIGIVDGTYAAHYRNSDTKRYLAVAEGDGVSFHRFYMGITKVSLVPAATGFGYKAEFYGDAAVQAQIASIGYKLWITENAVVTRTADFKNTLTLRLQNFDVANYGETAVNASVMITLTDGSVIDSDPTAWSIQHNNCRERICPFPAIGGLGVRKVRRWHDPAADIFRIGGYRWPAGRGRGRSYGPGW